MRRSRTTQITFILLSSKVARRRLLRQLHQHLLQGLLLHRGRAQLRIHARRRHRTLPVEHGRSLVALTPDVFCTRQPYCRVGSSWLLEDLLALTLLAARNCTTRLVEVGRPREVLTRSVMDTQRRCWPTEQCSSQEVILAAG